MTTGIEYNIQALIQVRMGSSRLPGKALCDIDGMTAIERVVESLRPSKYIKGVIITTSTEPEDDSLEELAEAKGIAIFRGDRINILKRFLDASEEYGADIIIRVTGDCPLVSYALSDYMIDRHLKAGADYTATETAKLPVGIYPEVISQKALKKLSTLEMDFDYSEYLSFYFTNNPHIFLIHTAPAPKEYQFPEYRLTLDYPKDLNMFNALYKKLREDGLAVELSNVLKVLKNHPEIAKLNAGLALKYKSDNILIEKIKQATKIRGPGAKR